MLTHGKVTDKSFFSIVFLFYRNYLSRSIGNSNFFFASYVIKFLIPLQMTWPVMDFVPTNNILFVLFLSRKRQADFIGKYNNE